MEKDIYIVTYNGRAIRNCGTRQIVAVPMTNAEISVNDDPVLVEDCMLSVSATAESEGQE